MARLALTVSFAKTRLTIRARPIPRARPRPITSPARGIIPIGLPVLISNCSNNYGPYQFPEKLIPADDPERR